MLHEPLPILVDNRIRVHKTTFTCAEAADLNAIEIETPLGMLVRAVLFWEWQRHIDHTGGEHFLMTRKWKQAGLTPENCRRWVDAHFENFSRDANLLIRAHPNFTNNPNQEIGRRLYRRIWGCYHKQNEQDPKRRHGSYGPRHPKNHEAYGAALRGVENIVVVHGPNFQFAYDIARPYEPAVLKL